MEKHYEKPDVSVIRYKKQVKTDAEEFTDSTGELKVRWSCRGCGQTFFIANGPLDYDDEDLREAAAAYDKHVETCPANPVD